jgi:hypothetical protein
MLRKRILVALGLMTAAGLVGGVLLCCTRRPQFTKAMADRIREGMTEDEVVTILGSPPGDYSTETGTKWGGGSGSQSDAKVFSKSGHLTNAHWVSDAGIVLVFFNDDGRVTDCSWLDLSGDPLPSFDPLPQPSFLDRLRDLWP